MKFLKTGKGKIITSILAVFFITAGGVALAANGAGDNLRAWYDKAFADTTDEALDEAAEYEEDAVSDFKEDYADRKNQKAGQIDRKRDWETNNSIENIDAAKDEHIEDLGNTKEEIMENMNERFYKIYMDAWIEIEARAEEAESLVNEDMQHFATTEGNAAIAQLNEDLDGAKNEAVSELEGAIEDAKAEISAELDDEREWLDHNLETEIDNKISLLTIHVGETLTDLTEEQEQLIADAASDKEDEAKDALDQVVENMNN